MDDRTPIFINSFNRLIWLKAMVAELMRFDKVGQITIVDEASTYQPLIDWYNSDCPVPVVRLRQNGGPRGVWEAIPTRTRTGHPYYIVTDPDLDLSGCPSDLIVRMQDAMHLYPQIRKAGPGIRLDDIPRECPWYERIMSDESGHSAKTWDGWWFDAALDTTFAMYRYGEPFAYSPAIRAPAPYQVRHLPYYHVPANLTDEDRWYIENLPQQFKSGLYFSTLEQDERQKLGI